VSDASTTTEWIEVRLPSGRNVLLRAVNDGGGDDDVGQVQDVRFSGLNFEALTATLHEVGTLINGALQTLTPAEAEVELGLGINARTGQLLVLFGKAAADASMKVTLRWHFDSRSISADEA
jgi:hypothetical protein